MGPIGAEGIAQGMFGRAQKALPGAERSVMGIQWVGPMDARLGPEGIVQWARQSVVKTSSSVIVQSAVEALFPANAIFRVY